MAPPRGQRNNNTTITNCRFLWPSRPKKCQTLGMNYLAHLHLASLADSSLLGNLMADFVRGDPDGQYSAEIVSGIRMHRRVDTLTDSLPEVKIARGYFRAEFRRVAPITLDVVWDHFLSRHWETLVPSISLEDFI